MAKVAQVSSPSSEYIEMILSKSGSTSVEETNKKALEFIEDVTMNADEVQARVLGEILSRNADVEYLIKHNLKRRSDRESFKKAIPVVTYEDIASYLKRIANGDNSPILCSQPITELLTSSGTSGGERKVIPSIEEDQLVTKPILRSLIIPVISQFVGGLENGKSLYFLCINHEFLSPGGVVVRASLTSYLKSQRFIDDHPNEIYTNTNISPKETILCPDSLQSLYSQMLSGLSQRAQVLRVGSVFASGLIRAIKFLEGNWELLCNDIRAGFPNPAIVTDRAVHDAVNRFMMARGPDPELAGFIEEECRKESWQGILRRLWPNAKHLDVIVTGAMAQYIPTLHYYSGGLPLVSTMYLSSEAYVGINLNPLCDPREVAYTIIPNMAYFEFLPVKTQVVGEAEAIDTFSYFVEEKLVDLVDVEMGKQYELVVTTYAGLYRYRVGDILEVAGFKNKTPQFKFVRRNNVVLSIDSDKTDEVELHNAVNTAVNNHLSSIRATLIEYTSYANTTTVPGHYVLFWEINHRVQSCDSTTDVYESVLEDCCLTVEENLSSIYRQFRVHCKSIGPLEIRVVESGTFDKLMDYFVGQGASVGQYKTPRCVKEAPVIELLNSRVVSKSFSREFPKWVPDHL